MTGPSGPVRRLVAGPIPDVGRRRRGRPRPPGRVGRRPAGPPQEQPGGGASVEPGGDAAGWTADRPGGDGGRRRPDDPVRDVTGRGRGRRGVRGRGATDQRPDEADRGPVGATRGRPDVRHHDPTEEAQRGGTSLTPDALLRYEMLPPRRLSARSGHGRTEADPAAEGVDVVPGHRRGNHGPPAAAAMVRPRRLRRPARRPPQERRADGRPAEGRRTRGRGLRAGAPAVPQPEPGERSGRSTAGRTSGRWRGGRDRRGR